jgi:hypothetical protein
MSVRRFRDVSEMPPPPPLDPNDPQTWVVIRDLWGLIARTLPPLYPPGVRRFRSIDEMNRARDDATVESARALHRAREAAKRG